MGILATTKIRGISNSIKQVNDNYIIIAETSSLINEYVYFATQTLQQFFDTGVGLQDAKGAANIIDHILIDDLLQTNLARLPEHELEESVNSLQQATREYTENIANLEGASVPQAKIERLAFLQANVINLARSVREQAWVRANGKVEASDQLAQDTVLIILISALIVALAGMAVEGASFTLVRDFTAQQESLLERYQKEAVLERNLREAEIKILHAQINPHFLFNTLNVISAIAFDEGTKRVTKIVNALSTILRYGLKFAGKLVTLSTEIDVIEKYLLIQKERFGERLRYSINVEPVVREMELPAMTLQPLVENALLHGIEPNGKGGLVRIVAYEQAGDILIEVSDSGQGNEPDTLKEILNSKKEANHLGLELVYKRLQHFYDRRLQMRIFTNRGRGFKVQIRICSPDSHKTQQDQLMVFPLLEEV